MASVLKQTYSNIEYIIIDGGSTDGSKEYIESNQQDLAYWVSEPDDGIYDAMNKGVLKANGEYLFFLNSGDYLLSNNIIESFVAINPTEDILYGFLKVQEKHRSWTKMYPKQLSFSFFLSDSLPHSAGGFFKRSGFMNELSLYDSSLKIMADWKWSVIALFKKGYSYRLIDNVIGVFEYGYGISSLPENRKLLNNERLFILNSEFKYIYPEVKSLLEFKKNQKKLMNSKFFKIAAVLKNIFKKVSNI
jgi:glycosyltransferase involved in cell wall biosynthesis